VRAEERTIWQGVVVDRDARLADMDIKLAYRDAEN